MSVPASETTSVSGVSNPCSAQSLAKVALSETKRMASSFGMGHMQFSGNVSLQCDSTLIRASVLPITTQVASLFPVQVLLLHEKLQSHLDAPRDAQKQCLNGDCSYGCRGQNVTLHMKSLMKLTSECIGTNVATKNDGNKIFPWLVAAGLFCLSLFAFAPCCYYAACAAQCAIKCLFYRDVAIGATSKTSLETSS